jgi:hypothetical protein
MAAHFLARRYCVCIAERHQRIAQLAGRTHSTSTDLLVLDCLLWLRPKMTADLMHQQEPLRGRAR